MKIKREKSKKNPILLTVCRTSLHELLCPSVLAAFPRRVVWKHHFPIWCSNSGNLHCLFTCTFTFGEYLANLSSQPSPWSAPGHICPRVTPDWQQEPWPEPGAALCHLLLTWTSSFGMSLQSTECFTSRFALPHDTVLHHAFNFEHVFKHHLLRICSLCLSTGQPAFGP